MPAQTVRTFLHQHIGTPDRPLIVAVSGGVDSLALLHVVAHQWSADKLIIAHLNHQLRDEATADAQFVQDTAAQLGIPYVIHTTDIAAHAHQHQHSIEQAARHARYDFLAQVARTHHAQHILTAHHADDQTETILMHWLRGTGLPGLQGMQPAAPVPGNPDVVLLRPLLSHPKSDLIAYCHTHNLHPREDKTNTDTAYFRNRIRHQLLPTLDAISPHFRQQTNQMAHLVTADNALLDQLTADAYTNTLITQADNWLQLDQARWLALPLSLRRRTLRHAVTQLASDDAEIGFRPLEQARTIAENNQTGAQAHIAAALTLTVGYNSLTLAHAGATPPITAPQTTATEAVLSLDRPLFLENGWVLTATHAPNIDVQTVRSNVDRWQTWIAIDHTPPHTLTVRGRQPGDTMQPLGMDGRHTSLKAMMTNRKIPAAHRPQWPLVLIDNHIAWLPGHITSHAYRITAATRTALHLRCHRHNP